jgi:hypothetical protein
MYGKTSHMGSLFLHGKTSQMWEDFPYIGGLPRYGKSSNTWADFPHMGSLPISLAAGASGSSPRGFTYTWDLYP